MLTFDQKEVPITAYPSDVLFIFNIHDCYDVMNNFKRAGLEFKILTHDLAINWRNLVRGYYIEVFDTSDSTSKIRKGFIADASRSSTNTDSVRT